MAGSNAKKRRNTSPTPPEAKLPKLGNAETNPLTPSLADQIQDSDPPNLMLQGQGQGEDHKYRGINNDYPPLSNLEDIYADMATKSLVLGFKKALVVMGNFKPRIATMCSGTESPILALTMFGDALLEHYALDIKFEHVFSAEIVPWKQAYIERNFGPPILFRDIREMTVDQFDDRNEEENSNSRPQTANVGFEDNMEDGNNIQEKGDNGTGKAYTAYGSLVDIPGDVDILIAGSSCVDFSRLNSRTKDLFETGESGDTFRGILNYAKRYRPAIIILENVTTAPWDLMKAIFENDDRGIIKHGKRHGVKNVWNDDEEAYACEYCILDSKDFYIPHTRRRGWMFCIRRDLLSERERNLPQKWTHLVAEYARPPSASIEDFVLPEDDPLLHRTKDEMCRSRENTRKDIDWLICQARYRKYREDEHYGPLRPITKWTSGSAKAPDYWWHGWVKVQVERLWETFDCAYLRNVSQGFDPFYKTRIWELSQSIDRYLDTTPWGHTCCLTPTGQPFLTTRGGPINGREVLALQGLPLKKLDLRRESNKEIQDFVGNAMTTTVALAAIISGITVACRSLRQNYLSREQEVAKPTSSAATINIPAKLDSNLQSTGSLDFARSDHSSVKELCDKASRSARLCYCEGLTEITKNQILCCMDCGHFNCMECGAIPSHRYEPSKRDSTWRVQPRDFANLLKKNLPMVIVFSGFEDEAGEQYISKYPTCDRDDWNLIQKTISYARKEEMRFRTVKRSHVWKVTYDSAHTILQLILSHGTAEWLLYGKVEPSAPNNSQARKLLQNPIARMVVSDKDVLQGTWTICVPVTQTFEITVTGTGELTSDWAARLGIVNPELVDKKVFTRINIAHDSNELRFGSLAHDIIGEYQLLPNCGTASGSLHKKLEPQTNTDTPSGNAETSVGSDKIKAPTVFLFLDPERLGHPMFDCFVFSTDIHRLTNRESRNCIAKVHHTWRPGSEALTSALCTKFGSWVNCDALKILPASKNATYTVPQKTVRYSIADRPSLSSTTCASPCARAALNILSCAVPDAIPDKHSWRHGNWRIVASTEQREFFESISWLTEKLDLEVSLSQAWTTLLIPEDLKLAEQRQICPESCAPLMPVVLWQRANSGKVKVVPYEDGQEAARYETTVKLRPAPFVIRAKIDDMNCGHLQIDFNLTSMAHRALAQLAKTAGNDELELAWCMDTTYEVPTNFSLDSLTLKDNKDDLEADFLFSNEENLQLRSEQLRSLQWMRGQEAINAPPWVEQETEEATILSLGWRAQVRASKATRVLGGVLADVVGYGKTAIVLALIHDQRQRAVEYAEKECERSIPVKATLVVVPRHLVKQWKDQAEIFLNNSYKILTLISQGELAHCTVGQIQTADLIIISWEIYASEPYWEKLAFFAALPEGPKLGGRAFKAWYERASAEIKKNTDTIQEVTSVSTFAQDLQRRVREADEDENLLRQLPTKRWKGAQYVKDVQQRKGQEKGNVAGEHAKVVEKRYNHMNKELLEDMESPCFEMFSFYRIVIDEYTYLTEALLIPVKALRSERRWILSGTPALADFADISTMADLLGAWLGDVDDTAGVIHQKSISSVRRDRTDFENFRAFANSYTPSWHMDRHRHAQNFLDQFARQNTAEHEEIPTIHYLKPVSMHTGEKLLYLELQHRIENNEGKVTYGGRTKDQDARTLGLDADMKDSRSPEEAFLKNTGHCDFMTSVYANASQDAAEVLLHGRVAEFLDFMSQFRRHLRLAVWLKPQWDELNQRQKDAAEVAYAKAQEEKKKSREIDQGETDAAEVVDAGASGAPATEEKKTAAKVKKPELVVDRAYDHWKQTVLQGNVRDKMATQFFKWLIDQAEAENKDTKEEEFFRDALTGDDLKKDRIAHQKLRAEAKKQRTAMRQYNVARKKGARVNNPNNGDGAAGNSQSVPDFRHFKINKDAEDAFQKFSKELRSATSSLLSDTQELVTRLRGLRMVQSSRKLQQWQVEQEDKRPHDAFCSHCGKTPPAFVDLFLNGECGHIICSTCVADSDWAGNENRICLPDVCDARIDNHRLKSAVRVASQTDGVCKYGAKLDAIINLIHSTRDDEQVLMFVQFDELINRVAAAFDEEGITHYALTSDSPDTIVVKYMNNFQNDKGPWYKTDGKRKCLILDPLTEAAAGINLINANHVILLAPLLTPSQYKYDASMRQCVGRAVRYGQKRMVHVYNFLALETFDVDLYQSRQQKKLVRKPFCYLPKWSMVKDQNLTEDGRSQDWSSGFIANSWKVEY